MKLAGGICLEVLGFFLVTIELGSGSIQENAKLKFPLHKPIIDFLNRKSFPNCGKIDSSLPKPVDKDDEITFAITDTVRGRHTWEASVLQNPGEGNFSLCQGTLISERAVLTTARCLFLGDKLLSVDKYHVVLGVHDTRPPYYGGTLQYPKISNVIPHPNFNISDVNYDYDLGIVLLEKSNITINEYVRPVCLWNEDYDLNNIVNKTGEMTGYFLKAGYEPAGILQTSRLRAISHETCFNEYKNFTEKYLRPNRNFCVKYAKGQSSCTLGAGSGFILEKEDNFFLRGIAIQGIPEEMRVQGKEMQCTEHSFYLLTDLGYYMDWIVEKVPDLYMV